MWVQTFWLVVYVGNYPTRPLFGVKQVIFCCSRKQTELYFYRDFLILLHWLQMQLSIAQYHKGFLAAMLFSSPAPVLTFLLDNISAYSTTELKSRCTGIRKETEMQSDRGFFFFFIFTCCQFVFSVAGPRVVGLEADESQQESSTSSWEACYARDSQSGSGIPRHHNHQPPLFSLISVLFPYTCQALYAPTL